MEKTLREVDRKRKTMYRGRSSFMKITALALRKFGVHFCISSALVSERKGVAAFATPQHYLCPRCHTESGNRSPLAKVSPPLASRTTKKRQGVSLPTAASTLRQPYKRLSNWNAAGGRWKHVQREGKTPLRVLRTPKSARR